MAYCSEETLYSISAVTEMIETLFLALGPQCQTGQDVRQLSTNLVPGGVVENRHRGQQLC